MVLVVQEGYRVQVFYFNGCPRCSWKIENGKLATDRVGETCLEGVTQEYALQMNQDGKLPKQIQRAFPGHEIGIQPLWQLDGSAWDYEVQSALHAHDRGIRISFG